MMMRRSPREVGTDADNTDVNAADANGVRNKKKEIPVGLRKVVLGKW